MYLKHHNADSFQTLHPHGFSVLVSQEIYNVVLIQINDTREKHLHLNFRSIYVRVNK